MRAPHGTTRRELRAGFTLIEVLIVIAIIAVLVALALPAVLKALQKGPEVQTGVEIGQMSTALESFKRQYGVDYVPSQITLDESCQYPNRNTVGSADWFAVTYLRKVFGSRIDLHARTAADLAAVPPNFIDWNGDGVCSATVSGGVVTANPVTLEGEHALVFFLGGIPSSVGVTNACTGFCTDPTNPAQGSTAAAGLVRQPAFYEFKTNHLQKAAGGFLVYLDFYETASPYAYFSHYSKGNDYQSDCPSIGPVLPYKDMTGRFINPNGFQIISAGRDGTFGPGGTWNTSSGWPISSPGADDQANFSKSILGAPQS